MQTIYRNLTQKCDGTQIRIIQQKEMKTNLINVHAN